MNILQILMLILPMEMNVGVRVYVPPTTGPRSACSAARAAAYVERTGSTRTNDLAGMRPATGLVQDSFTLEVG